jgi:serine/threonine protein kinase
MGEGVVAQRYVRGRALGRGSFGTTYAAIHVSTGNSVALKVLDLAHLGDWKDFDRFAREAAVLRGLDHPAIPRFVEAFEAGTDENKRYCIAQELAPGRSLEALVEAGWRASEAEARQIAAQSRSPPRA